MNSEAIVSKHTCHFNKPPTKLTDRRSVDCPLMGNGDLGVAVAGPPEALKCQFPT
jgi:hypothetical protein